MHYLGFVLNRKNVIILIISIEIILLSVTLQILINSGNFDDVIGQIFSIIIITIAYSSFYIVKLNNNKDNS